MGEQSFIRDGHRHGRRAFVETLAHGLFLAMEHALDAESIASGKGFLQAIDPRAKLVGLFALICATVLATSLIALAALFFLAVVLALSSKVTLARLCKQVWVSVLLFTGLIAIPSIVIVPGDPLIQVPLVHWTVTVQGLRSAAFLIGRAETTATFGLLLILSTPWPHVLKALRSVGVPVVLVAILGMTHRYIFVFLQTAMQMFEARRSRIVGPVRGSERRRLVSAGAGVLLGKAFHLSGEVHLAMVSRGYRGDIRLLDDFRSRPIDWIALVAALSIPAIVLWAQR